MGLLRSLGIILVYEDVVSRTKVLPLVEVFVFRSKILIIILASSEMDLLKDAGCILILLVLHTHLDHFQNGLDQGVLAPVKRYGI